MKIFNNRILQFTYSREILVGRISRLYDKYRPNENDTVLEIKCIWLTMSNDLFNESDYKEFKRISNGVRRYNYKLMNFRKKHHLILKLFKVEVPSILLGI